MDRRPGAADRPLVLAHRGASRHAPGNSLEAFRLAGTQGADGIEFDVRFTADHVVVVHHDAGIRGFGPLIDRRFADLRSAHPGVPTLDETLAVAGDMILDIEIKNHSGEPDFDPSHRMADIVVAWATDHGLSDRALITSFDPGTLDRVRELAPSLTTGLLLEHGFAARSRVATAAGSGYRWLLPRNGASSLLLRRLVREAHGAGLRLGTWTVDASRALRRVREAGCDAVITNDPQGALAAYS